MLSIDSIETYGHETSKDLVCKKEEIKCNNIIKQYKMFNFDYFTKEGIKEHNRNWPEIPDHPYRILNVGSSGSGRTNALLNNVINHEADIDKKVLYAKDPYEAKHQFLINKRRSTSLKYSKDSIAFIEYTNNMDDIYKNIEDYNPKKKLKNQLYLMI